ncbi:conserved protein of unknown function [Candidatus Hydrogenisulfobacillus filiaventi]|uniref:Uncharacterized protein n=1 Tax=Candidatus Hydrogenisulfobacillus filiaventi TaxID=2707344 RepID=A0A6F8ZIU7_9FIRM|nr:conserved protein of unknown function [Candidatus Hydrogenisulfobacillus filiaventi]
MTTTYRPQPLARAWQAVVEGRLDPHIALGDFLDDWRRAPSTDRALLIVDPIPDSADPTVHRWGAFAAALVEHLTRTEGLPTPPWAFDERWVLPEPWFMLGRGALWAWQMVATPPAWKRRRIFGGDETMLIGRV